MHDYLQEGFRYFHLLAISAAILLLFALLGLAKYRVAWYFSISAPAAFLIPFHVGLLAYLSWPNWYKGPLISFIVVLPALLLTCWIYWIAPIVFVLQCQELKRRHFVPMNQRSLVNCFVLVGLYLWADLVAAFLDAVAHA